MNGVPADFSIHAACMIPSDKVIAADPCVPAVEVVVADPSVLVVDGLLGVSEFGLMSLPSKVPIPVICVMFNDAKSKLLSSDYQAQRE